MGSWSRIRDQNFIFRWVVIDNVFMQGETERRRRRRRRSCSAEVGGGWQGRSGGSRQLNT